MYLLDTNVIVYFLEGTLPDKTKIFLNEIVDTQSNISVITKMEALGFNFKTGSEETSMQSFIDGSTVINISDIVVEKTISLRKSKKIKLPDAIIAATAMIHDLVLISRNKNDFKDINGLNLIDPFDV